MRTLSIMKTWPAPIVRLLRPSLRMAMVVVLALGLILGWFVNGARVQRDAVASIERSGGSVYYGDRYKNYRIIFEKLGVMTWLRRNLGHDYFMCVVRVKVRQNANDLMLARLNRLTTIQEPHLSGSPLNGVRTSRPDGLQDSMSLEIGKTKTSADLLASLQSLKSLTRVDFEGIPCDDAGLAHLGRLPALETLDLNHCPISDAGMVHAEGLKNLIVVDLSGTSIGDAGLSHFVGCRKLQAILLDGTKITAAGLDLLAKLPEVKIITAYDTSVTAEDVKALRKAHPKVEFRR